jgi:hypothetical protein
MKNLLSEDYLIDDMGYLVEADSTINLSDQFTFAEICDSNDLKTLISDGTSLILEDGVSELTISEALNYLTRENVYDTRSYHYTKSEMQTPGESVIHWDNLNENP